MGGWGSGRSDYATTPTVGQCRQLDVNDLTDMVDYPGSYATTWWGDRDDPEASITVRFEGEDDAERASHLRLEYTVTDRGGKQTEYEYPVPLEYTDCNFGGVRPWFRCPGIVDGTECRKRVGKLYLPPGGEYFLCRHCYDLGYRSSRVSGNEIEQAELWYRRAFAKADAKGRRPHPNNEPHFPERAKGEHHDTFEDHCEEVRAARAEWHEAMNAKMRELTARLQDPPL